MNFDTPPNQDNNVATSKNHGEWVPIVVEMNDPAVTFSFARSSGAGGQAINKLETKAIIYFTIADSQLSDDQKRALLCKACTPKENQVLHDLQNKINARGDIILTCQESSGQLDNKIRVLANLNVKLNAALKPQKKRKEGLSKKAKGKIRAAQQQQQEQKFKSRKEGGRGSKYK